MRVPVWTRKGGHGPGVFQGADTVRGAGACAGRCGYQGLSTGRGQGVPGSMGNVPVGMNVISICAPVCVGKGVRRIEDGGPVCI